MLFLDKYFQIIYTASQKQSTVFYRIGSRILRDNWASFAAPGNSDYICKKASGFIRFMDVYLFIDSGRNIQIQHNTALVHRISCMVQVIVYNQAILLHYT